MSTDTPDTPDTAVPPQPGTLDQESRVPTEKGDGRKIAVAAGLGIGTIGLVLGGCAVLMVGVVLFGLLSAIAIPNFIDMQYRAKRAEVPSNVDGIKAALIAYDAAFDTYVEVSEYVPDSLPGKNQRPWRSGTGFDTLGWGPDGQVRGSYKVVSRSSTDFLVTGISDVDGDGSNARFTATKSIHTIMTTGPATY